MKVITKLILASFVCVSLSALGQMYYQNHHPRDVRTIQPHCWGTVRPPSVGCTFYVLYSDKPSILTCKVDLKRGVTPRNISINFGDLKVMVNNREIKNGEILTLEQFTSYHFKVYTKYSGYKFPDKPKKPAMMSNQNVAFWDEKGVLHGGNNPTAVCKAHLPSFLGL